MQVRRALIAFVLVFAGVTVIASIAGPRDEDDPPEPSLPEVRRSPLEGLTVAFRHPVEEAPPVRNVRGGTRVVVRVQAAIAGDVEIPGLGLSTPVAPGTPAVFDILAERPGRYDVVLRSIAGERTQLGSLAVGR